MERINERLKWLIRQLSNIVNEVTGELEQIGTSTDRYNAIKQQLLANERELKTIDQELNRDAVERQRIKEALDASNKELEDFIYMTSHDFREPLRKISSFGAILKESLGGRIEREDQENLEFMIDGAERMTQMIEDLLAYSRMNTKTISIETVDLNDVIEQLKKYDLVTPLEDTGARVEVPHSLPKIPVDPILIRQLFRNLILHGLKHAKKEVKPRIVVQAEQTAEDKVKIQVENNGLGTETENDKDMFKMSLRPHSRHDEEVGSGLAICKKIVDRHGGRIGVDAEPGAGSTLWFILPVSQRLEQQQDVTLS